MRGVHIRRTDESSFAQANSTIDRCQFHTFGHGINHALGDELRRGQERGASTQRLGQSVIRDLRDQGDLSGTNLRVWDVQADRAVQRIVTGVVRGIGESGFI